MSLHRQTIPTFGVLESSDIENVKDFFEIEYYKAGDILLQPGQVSDKLYFIFKGMVACENTDKRILWLEFENHIVADILSFTSREPSDNYLRVCENGTVVISITHEKIHVLFSEYHHWALWGNFLTQQALMRLASFYKRIGIKDATERYNELINYVPNLLERVSLKDIASCLGISPVSLSRIRAAYKKQV